MSEERSNTGRTTREETIRVWSVHVKSSLATVGGYFITIELAGTSGRNCCLELSFKIEDCVQVGAPSAKPNNNSMLWGFLWFGVTEEFP